MGEAVGVLLSCGAAVLGWVVVVGGNAAAPITGGLSATVNILGVSAAIASSAQCGNGLIRIGSEILDDGQTSDILDSQEWYHETVKAIDVISLAGAATSSLMTFKVYQMATTASSRSIIDILKGMTRPERKRLTKEIIRVNHPGVSNKLLKGMVREGKYPKSFSSSRINTSLMLHVKDAAGATLSFSGSAFSGSVKNLVIGIYEEAK